MRNLVAHSAQLTKLVSQCNSVDLPVEQLPDFLVLQHLLIVAHGQLIDRLQVALAFEVA